MVVYIFSVSKSGVKSVIMSKRGGLSDEQLAMMLEEDEGSDDDTGELTGEQWQEGEDDSDEEGGEESCNETMEEGDG